MGRLDYSTPTPGKDEPEEGAGDRSAYFLKYHSRGDESSSAPEVSANTETVSQTEVMAWRQSCVYWHLFLVQRAAEQLFGKVPVLAIKIITKLSLKPFVMGGSSIWRGH